VRIFNFIKEGLRININSPLYFRRKRRIT